MSRCEICTYRLRGYGDAVSLLARPGATAGEKIHSHKKERPAARPSRGRRGAVGGRPRRARWGEAAVGVRPGGYIVNSCEENSTLRPAVGGGSGAGGQGPPVRLDKPPAYCDRIYYLPLG
ncbi:hypothetical protein EVAR_292_1 [Eumeta japonica]|uniref:Uncharacterized protein n=1 Tax=Eumeta variegata TaxID=151549 RepID=A0A4C1SBR7_EUMVA|nr:hypothetical protein EVAR_292_1 [Eumeta japonica]